MAGYAIGRIRMGARYVIGAFVVGMERGMNRTPETPSREAPE